MFRKLAAGRAELFHQLVKTPGSDSIVHQDILVLWPRAGRVWPRGAAACTGGVVCARVTAVACPNAWRGTDELERANQKTARRRASMSSASPLPTPRGPRGSTAIFLDIYLGGWSVCVATTRHEEGVPG